ncbi:MAG: hypothetical protein JO296_18795 [Pseudonocardiales bacterium]|nr:hypothetical protein [Pseudonocardiales bacterium]MBV9652168.1 hypothetical protein [Pseudonocardiales bacterium]
MSDSLHAIEIDGQHAELLPARTVLSTIGIAKAGGQCGGNGGVGGNGGKAAGGIGVNALNIILYPHQDNYAANAWGGAGGDANGGPCH